MAWEWWAPLFTAGFALKLVLVAAVVYTASLAARRFGHGVAGTLAGLPMIAGPIMGFVLWQAPAGQVHRIALATLSAFPAMVVHMVVFAQLARRTHWGWAWLAANAAFMASGAVLLALALPFPATAVLAAAVPWIGLRLMPAPHDVTPAPPALRIPPLELVLRIAAAVALAAVVMLAASPLPAAVSGLLLALPITGNVLPCFTQARYGAAATVELLRGFLRGLAGFLALFIVLALALPAWGAVGAYGAAWAAALVVARVMLGVSARRRSVGEGPRMQG